jgi:hypothetical protein
LRQTLDETYRMIDTTLNMVIIRLGDILLLAAADDFLREPARLDHYSEWIQAEREFCLCRSLRVALITAGLGLASGAVIPGPEWRLDWRDGKKSVQENGLHDLLRL